MTGTGPDPAATGVDRGVTPLPTVVDLRDLLERLLGRDVEITLGGPMVDTGARGGAQVSTYEDRYGKLRALLVADAALVARAGAAIALSPRGGADAALQDGDLPAGLLENAREVLDVTASLFSVAGAPHVTPGRFYPPGALLPPEVAHLVRAYVRRLDLDVALTGYGSGRLAVIVP